MSGNVNVKAAELRRSALVRLAKSLDLPVELLGDHPGLGHWANAMDVAYPAVSEEWLASFHASQQRWMESNGYPRGV